jgi:hypothetical protein
VRVGSVVHQVVTGPGGRGSFPADYEVTAYEPPSRFAFRVIKARRQRHRGELLDNCRARPDNEALPGQTGSKLDGPGCGRPRQGKGTNREHLTSPPNTRPRRPGVGSHNGDHVSYGDRFPVTGEGGLVGVLLILVGLVVTTAPRAGGPGGALLWPRPPGDLASQVRLSWLGHIGHQCALATTPHNSSNPFAPYRPRHPPSVEQMFA